MGKRISFENEIIFDGPAMTGVEMAAAEDIYMGELQKMADEGHDIVAMLSDNGMGGMARFRKAYPDRVFDVGIAEPNEVGIAAGFALSGKRVYAQFFGPFLPLRSLDQVHTDIAYNELPVCLIDTHSGLTSAGGPTHYNLMDIAVMRNIPNMTVVVPGDPKQYAKAIRASVELDGPMFLRAPRSAEPLVYTTQDYDYQLGKAVEAAPGNDFTIIGIGIGVAYGVSASNGLTGEGISVRVLDMHTVRPLDNDAIVRAAEETGGIITVEDHWVTGGLGSAVAEVLADAGLGIPFRRLGVPNHEFNPLGEFVELYKHFGFDPEGLKRAVREMLGKDSSRSLS